MSMLKIEKLTKYYGKNKGVENINLEVQQGEIFGFIGPNGAGKSTTIKCIMNQINKTSGNIYIDGEEDSKDNTKIRNIIGYLPSEIHLYDDYTVKQMIEYNSTFYKENHKKRINYLVKKLDLNMNKKIEELSLGNLKKLGIVLAMMHEPKILILDEATSGLDPLMQETFYELLEEEKKKGTTIFFSSHVLSEIKRICDRVGIIKNGNLIKVEKIENLLSTNFNIITIKSKETDKLHIEDIMYQDNDTIKFIYKDDINELIKKINNIKIDKILIEDPSLEEIFMHFYE